MNQPIRLLRGWKREMRRSETVTATVFPTTVEEGDGDGLGAGLGVGKG
jgi:hypothetical protein